MKWSWRLGRIAGIELRVHATFLFLLAWVALAAHREGGTAGAAAGVLFTLAVFGAVVLHEFGHALMGRRLGARTRDITLLPIGGVARLESIPTKPSHELQTALAGPAVTLAIALALYAALRLLGASAAPITESVTGSSSAVAFIAQLMWVNVWLLGFNLLPAFPMDGGRVLRALLATRMDHQRATEHAARVGRLFALVFGIAGLVYNPFLVFIALFVWLGAAGEAAATQMRSAFAGLTVEQAMIRDIRTLAPDDTLGTALDHVLAGFQEDFPVVERGRVVGMLTRARMLRSVGAHGSAARVGDVMEREVGTATTDEPLDDAVTRLLEGHRGSMPVLRGGELRGILTSDNVSELVMIESALQQASGRRDGSDQRRTTAGTAVADRR